MADVENISFLPNQTGSVPFKVLVLAPLGGENIPEYLCTPIEINQHNFDQVIREFAPCIEVSVDNDTLCNLLNLSRQTLTLSYEIESYKDFEPWAIVNKDPSLLEISMIIEAIHILLQEEGEIFNTSAFVLEYVAIKTLTEPKINRQDLEVLVCELELVLSEVLNQILHQQNWQQLEAAWRGVYLLCQTSKKTDTLIIECTIATKELLWEDLFSSADLIDSNLYQQIYVDSIGQYGAIPYGALLLDDYFSGTGSDLTLLKGLTHICSKAHLPVITAASASMFNVEDFNTLQDSAYISEIHSTASHIKWRSYIATEEASFLTLTMPRLLFRNVYDKSEGALSWFKEFTGTSHQYCLWGNASYSFVNNLLKSFAGNGFCSLISGNDGGEIELGALLPKQTSLPVEIAFSEDKEAELISLGFNPVCTRAFQNKLLFESANSVRWANIKLNHKVQNEDSIASAQLQYLLIVVRIIHCLKIMFRESIGTTSSAPDLSSILNRWVRQFVSDVEVPSLKVRSQRPLKDARVVVLETSDVGWFDISISLTPHMKYLGKSLDINTSLSINEGVN
jgi:type VI secretion system protein ImpC